MSGAGILALGALAGFTIFLGLPAARLRTAAPGMRAALNAGAIGILLFLFIEVMHDSFEVVEEAAEEHEWGELVGNGVVVTAAFLVGLLALAYYERWVSSRRTSVGPGAAAVAEFATRPSFASSPARRLALLIAIGIGVHNFAEGLAIGQSAAGGAFDLALLLVIGFGLHNATEGFGIVAPLAAEQDRPGWGFLAVLGLIGGGPTFLGTLIGQSFVNETLSIAFLAAAGGSILYVVLQLVGVAGKLGRKNALYWGVSLGVLAGFATEFVIKAAGA